jgi:hypothetical protein
MTSETFFKGKGVLNDFKALALLTLFISLTTAAGIQGAEAVGVNEEFAVVGRTIITGKDISYRIKTEQAYGNEAITDEVALISLVNDALEEEAAGMNGVAVTQEEINSFNKHVDETTKAPEILEKVKLAFGKDRSSYERLYLKPKIMNRKLRSFYDRDAGIHKAERALIEKAYSLVSSGKTFQEAAEACGLKASTTDIEDKASDMPAELQRYIPKDEKPAKAPIISILETMKEGEIHKNIVEDEYGYKVIRLAGKKENKYSVEAITAVKRPFDEWLREQVNGIKISILDAGLRGSVLKKYPNIWWIKRL